MAHVIVGLSGGVDSAVSAALLLDAGHHVEGLFMSNWAEDDDGYCTSAADFQDARRVCEELGIPLHRASFEPEYRERVFAHFLAELAAGRTPNPDVLCNREVKFGVGLAYARRLGAERFATGHYARIGNGGRLLRGIDAGKDQSYFLHALDAGQLAHCEFPVGHLHKPEVRKLARERGIDIPRLRKDYSFDWLGNEGSLKPALFFNEARYGRDVLLRGVTLDSLEPRDLARHVDAFPLPEDARAKLKAFLLAEGDVLAGQPAAERDAYLHGTSYMEFLRGHFGLPDAALQVFSNASSGFWGLPAENLSVAECLWSGLPGAHVVGGMDEPGLEEDDRDTAMFPDGNSSIARLLVRSLVPGSFPEMAAGADPFGIVTQRLDYGAIDRAGSAVRLRLNATAVQVANSANGAGVTVDYVKDGQLLRVPARQAVLACYNAIVPYLAPALPPAQKAALTKCVKRPMLVVNTLLRDGRALRKLGIKGAQLPGSFLQNLFLVSGINVGDYHPAWRPEDPCVMQSFASFGDPLPAGSGVANQARAARAKLLGMTFEDFEREIRTVMNGLLGPGGFDAARDILAITVNRWPHGYARDHLDLEDADWNAEPPPEVVGRQRFGNIAIANSDAGADAYTHAAIDQAWRAVTELAADP